LHGPKNARSLAVIAPRIRTAALLTAATLAVAAAAPAAVPAAVAPSDGGAPSVEMICLGCAHRHPGRTGAERHRRIQCLLAPHACAR
jgi:hypothetical protein